MRLVVPSAFVLGCAGLAGQALTRPGTLSVLNPASSATQAQQEMLAAQKEGKAARERAAKLEQKARQATRKVQKTARESAALAARIQETEAEIAAQKARLRLLAAQRSDLGEQLAERQGPLAGLTGSLQRLSRRPPLLALLRPGTVRDTVYLRALLDTMLPEVDRRTAELRAAIARGQALRAKTQAASRELATREAQMRERRQALAALESRQRLESRRASGLAAREGERALALAEKARDLGELVEEVGRQGELRETLANLPGPIMRPPRPQEARVLNASQFVPPPAGLPTYMLPVTGRVIRGFGEEAPGEARSGGIVLETRPGAQVVAPAPGRVAFAGRYRGFGQIVIVEHEGGWTSLVTGLVRLHAAVGETVVAGSPIGLSGPRAPQVMVELRRDGEPVNPLSYIRSL